MSNNQPPACPECEKLSGVSEESNKIGEFLDWMMGQGLVIARWVSDQDDRVYPEALVPACRGATGINQLLAKFYQIDLDEVERERVALLEWLRKNNQGEANGKN